MSKEKIKIEANIEIIRETEAAYAAKINGKFGWLPKSQVELTDSTIELPMWLANKIKLEVK